MRWNDWLDTLLYADSICLVHVAHALVTPLSTQYTSCCRLLYCQRHSVECLHDGSQAGSIVPVGVHAEHLHCHEDENRHGCVHQCPVLCIPLQKCMRAMCDLLRMTPVRSTCCLYLSDTSQQAASSGSIRCRVNWSCSECCGYTHNRAG